MIDRGMIETGIFVVPSRVCLIGNPTDGYRGRGISACTANHHAIVTVARGGPDGGVLELQGTVRSLKGDLLELAGLPVEDGGIRLLQVRRVFATWIWNGCDESRPQAACAAFAGHCRERGVQLPPTHSFRASYETTIPRGVGLSGSSALVTGMIRALCWAYGVEMGPLELPRVARAAEVDHLGNTAGWGDFVVQSLGGLLLMDYTRQQGGHLGDFRPLDPALLPARVWLVWSRVPKPLASGLVHLPVRERFDRGDPEAVRCAGCFQAAAAAAARLR